MTLSQFLIKAKVKTYASGGEGKKFEFSEGEFKYQDKYFGFNPFIGEETVWQNGEPIWGMNYYGRVLNNNISAKEIYIFLKQALKNVEEDKPFRGPEEFSQDDFKYSNQCEGGVENFRGKEEIFYQGQKVYELNYHGGKIN